MRRDGRATWPFRILVVATPQCTELNLMTALPESYREIVQHAIAASTVELRQRNERLQSTILSLVARLASMERLDEEKKK